MKRTNPFPKRSSRFFPGLSQGGFTLLEVMAALVILVIAMTAAYATFQFQHTSFTVQNRVTETQQNLRSAVEIISRDIRLAGYGIPSPVSIPAGILPGGSVAIRNLQSVNSTTGPDEIYLMYLYDMDSNMPPTNITKNMPNPSSEFDVAAVAGFSIGDLCIVTDGSFANLFEITEVQTGSVKLQHNPGGGARVYNLPTGPAGAPPGGYTLGSTIAKARFARYFIDRTDPAHPTLMLDRMNNAAPQPLSDDIEDLQIQYGLDTDGDFAVDTWTNAPTAAQGPQIKQVRLMLSARTRMTEKGWNEVRPALGDRAGGTTADGYRRRTIDVAIDLRNPGA
ncbi:MAG: hypothetical protein A2Z40_04910 [Deltaproteobacteria bacterium RBG_19FT_COMBO_60_16]|nr:MAG: hypothetical protein A2Z40_04910 [Deltaproteobacteria bacterium RBG_19FT_COMBO_60_16]